MTLGVPRQDSVLMREGQLVTWPELMGLRDHGAVADLNLRYFDRQGQPVASKLDQCIIGLSIEEIRRIDRVVIVAGGRRSSRRSAPPCRGTLPTC